jgi:hypothetical protein
MSESTAPDLVAEDTAAALDAAVVHQQLREAQVALREMAVERDEARQAAAGLSTRVEALTAHLETQRLAVANAARERDDYGMRLIDAEQRAAALSRKPGAVDPNALLRRVEELEDELVMVRRTVSWRVTGPLRSIRGALSPRSER